MESRIDASLTADVNHARAAVLAVAAAVVIPIDGHQLVAVLVQARRIAIRRRRRAPNVII
jgi:hypothetical protein